MNNNNNIHLVVVKMIGYHNLMTKFFAYFSNILTYLEDVINFTHWA